MASIEMSPHFRTHVDVDLPRIDGGTVREALDSLFAANPRLRGYVLDDRGAVRKHVVVFLNGSSVRDRVNLSDPLPPDGEIFLMQALSGG